MILTVILLCAIMLLAFLWLSGFFQREKVTEGIGGYKITVPMTAEIRYSNIESNNGMDNNEDIYINWRVDSADIIGQTLQAGEFAELVKDETTERLGVSNNWLGTEDYETVTENDADHIENESKTWHKEDSDIDGAKGYQIVSNSKMKFTFKTVDGTTVFTKILTQPLTLRVKPQSQGTWSTTREYYMHCYIPKHVLPNGTHELDATVDYEVDGYWIEQNWGNGAFGQTTSALNNRWTNLIGGGEWAGDFTKLSLIAVSTLAVTVAFGVLAGVCYFVGVTALVGGTSTYYHKETPQPLKGSGTLHFRVILEPEGESEGVADEHRWVPGQYIREIIGWFSGGTNGFVTYGGW